MENKAKEASRDVTPREYRMYIANKAVESPRKFLDVTNKYTGVVGKHSAVELCFFFVFWYKGWNIACLLARLLASSDLLISKSEFSAVSFVEVLDLVYLLVLVCRVLFFFPVGRKMIAFDWQTNKHQTIVRVNFAVMRFRAVLVFFSAGLELLLLGAFVSLCSLM